MTNLDTCTLPESASILEALKLLNISPAQTLFILNGENSVVGVITDGDIRRALIGGATLETTVGEICIRKFEYFTHDNYTLNDVSRIREKGIYIIPILNKEAKIERIINLRKQKTMLPLDAVIMAGGRGERLRPLTDEKPKPLLPLGNKVIMEYNVDNIASHGIDNVTVCIRYLGEQIRHYFSDGSDRGLRIRYMEEEKPLGTLGAITNIRHFEHNIILVMNSDLFTNIDLEEFYRHFVESGADMSVAATPYNISVPYAVMKTEGERVTSFEEKPTYTYYSNAGIYLIKRSMIEKLPQNEHYDATDLMEQIVSCGGNLTYFPITGYWLDIGTPEEYRKAREIIQFIKVQTQQRG